MINRRQFLLAAGALGLTSLAPGALWAMGADDRFTIAQLKYPDPDWNPRPSALRHLLLEVDKRTSVTIGAKIPALAGLTPKIFDYPFLTLAGDHKFQPFSNDLIANLRTYLQAGGFLFIDCAEGVPDGPFAQAAARELRRIFPDKKLTVVPKDHVLYKSFYLIDQPVGRVATSSVMRGIFDDDRLVAVISYNDLMGAWARDNFGNWVYSVVPGGAQQREIAFRMGINLVMYALCINYKDDQVHVPFILRRRQWRVK